MWWDKSRPRKFCLSLCTIITSGSTTIFPPHHHKVRPVQNLKTSHLWNKVDISIWINLLWYKYKCVFFLRVIVSQLCHNSRLYKNINCPWYVPIYEMKNTLFFQSHGNLNSVSFQFTLCFYWIYVFPFSVFKVNNNLFSFRKLGHISPHEVEYTKNGLSKILTQFLTLSIFELGFFVCYALYH